MNLLNPIKISVKNLLSSKWRSFLTVLGIIIGVASVIIVMAIGASAQQLILEQVSGAGSNLIGVLPGASSPKGPPASALGVVTTTLKYADLEALLKKSNAPEIVDAAGYVSGSATIQYQQNSSAASYQGVSASFINIENNTLKEGRFFIKEEDTNLSRVAVLGYNRANDLFPNTDPVGKSITIKDLNFTVVGVLDKKGSSAFSSPDDLVYVPLFTAQKLLLGIDYLNFIRAKVDSANDLDRAVADVTATIREQHHITDPTNDDFSVRTTAQALSILTSVTDVLTFFLASIAAISLLVGGVGIMNIMLIAVNQRIREIGLRKAVGAKNSNVVAQFLVESVFITFAGGILGIIFGILIAFLASLIINRLGYHWQFLITIQSIVLATTVTIFIGLIFGLYPARKAARVSPMEALRYE